MSDIEPNIFCEFEQSTINSNLYICKYCNTVLNNKDSRLQQGIICPSRIDAAALDPRFDQIRLTKTTIETQDGAKIAEYDHDYDQVKKSKILGDWWFGTGHTNQVSPQKTNTSQHSLSDLTDSSHNQCSQAQIDARLAICNTCEFYQNSTCLKCGCALSRERNFMNKLYWKDKSCPIGKWGQEV